VLHTAVRWSGNWFTGRRFLWLIGIMLAGSIIWLAGSHLGPGLRAARGQGIVGLWTAQEQDDGQWYGEFISSSGTVTLPYVYYAGSLSAVQAGTTVPALDTGAGDEVYPLAGSAKWIHDVIGIVVGTVALIALLARGLFVTRRRRRVTRAGWFSSSQLGAARPAEGHRVDHPSAIQRVASPYASWQVLLSTVGRKGRG